MRTINKKISIPSKALLNKKMLTRDYLKWLVLLSSKMVIEDGVYSATAYNNIRTLAKLNRGQCLITIEELAALWNCTQRQAKTALDYFEKEKIINVSSTAQTKIKKHLQPNGKIIEFVFD